ncbi:hypothetical protein BYZ73_19780 [Rhodovulum viride]|uniref:Hemolytic domain-containing protein n=2 Tax=Rhodovulum viride TaxID=1231134 RepID=A0ABX9DD99_9RHOB|nr:hypothetical protein BYZ73_19780 [Rhodovulum viride]
MSLWTIDFYQRRISPRKGLICTYRAVHGGTGCSGFVRQRIAETGVLRAMPAIAARFAACQEAAGNSKKRRGKGACDLAYGCCDTLVGVNDCAACSADACRLFSLFR